MVHQQRLKNRPYHENWTYWENSLKQENRPYKQSTIKDKKSNHCIPLDLRIRLSKIRQNFCEQSTINYDKIDYDVTVDHQKNVLYEAWWKLTSLFENYIRERVRSPSPEIQNYYLENTFPNLLWNTFFGFYSRYESN